MNYTADDIARFFTQYERHISHVCVLHTDIHSFGLTQRAIDARTYSAKADLRHALNIFARLLYPKHPNYPRRKPMLYRPLCLVTVEGAKETMDPSQTVHFNLSLGNLPSDWSTASIKAFLRQAWHIKADQSNDIFVGRATDHPSEARHWLGYGVKEAQKDRNKVWSTEGVWDVCNCWIPHQALKQTDVS